MPWVLKTLRYADVTQLLFFIEPLYLIGMWFGVGQDKYHKDTCLIGIGLCLQIFLTTSHSTMHIIGKTYVFDSKVKQTYTSNYHNEMKGGLIFNMILLMLCRKFSISTQVPLCKCYGWKLEEK
jgi:hypothetical protein